MKIAFVVGGLYSLANGVAWIMRDLAAALGRAGSPVDVYAAECYGRGKAPIGHIFDRPTQWIARKGLWLGGLSWAPTLKPVIQQAVAEHDIIHNHSVWMLPNSYSSRSAKRFGKPVVITAHGILEPWALAHSRWKKQLVGAMFQQRELLEADCLQTNSLSEVEGIRQYGIKSPVAIIPNGVDLEVLDQPADRSLLEAQYPELKGKRLILFMARLHVKKGLEHLLTAWGQLAPRHPDWHLVIGGPDNGYEHQARAIAAAQSLERRVTFTGNLQNEMSRAARQSAEIFAQPSFSEGFSMSILESMAAGCPVLITPGCNFPQVKQERAGVIVDPNTQATTAGLEQLLNMSDSERTEMGARGRHLIETHYTWDIVAEQTLALYHWLLGNSPRPDFIIDG
ncbi:MAG: glycosyltransferase [Planctomycetaceae bacterium]|nr:glycosyltransferase [Planctomycetaceae bacterium]